MDKMTIEKAREMLKSLEDGDSLNAFASIPLKMFIEGFESRQAEIDELKKKVIEWEVFKAEYKKAIGASLWPELEKSADGK